MDIETPPSLFCIKETVMIHPVCKFNDSKASAINCSQFIFETTDVQAQTIHASSHHIGLWRKGSGVLTINGVSRTICEGDVYVILKGSDFSIRRISEMEYFYISFSGWHADELMERLMASREEPVFTGEKELLGFWTSCFDRSENGNLDLFIESVLLFTVASLAKTEKEKSALADRISEYANEHFEDPDLSLTDIARELGYDPKYLSAMFKAKKHVTFTQYLRSLRIQHAAFLFDEGVESVKVVAMLSGFSDALYFSRIFRQETGKTPSEYIKKQKMGTE